MVRRREYAPRASVSTLFEKKRFASKRSKAVPILWDWKRDAVPIAQAFLRYTATNHQEMEELCEEGTGIDALKGERGQEKGCYCFV